MSTQEAAKTLAALQIKLAQSQHLRLTAEVDGKSIVLEKGNAASAERLCLWIDEEPHYEDWLEQIAALAMKYDIDLTSLEWGE